MHVQNAQALREPLPAQVEARVYLVDDSAVARRNLSLLMHSVGLKAETFPNAERFLEAYDPDLPGCLVVDVRLRGMSGLALLENLAAQEFAIPVILLSGHGDIPTAVRAMHIGAADFIEKPFREQTLLDAVHMALERDAEARKRRNERNDLAARSASLTPRERQVLDLVVDGLPSKDIAARLGVTSKAIEAHRSRIMKKMGVRCVAELVRVAVLAQQT